MCFITTMWSSWWYHTFTVPRLDKLRQAEILLLEYSRRHTISGQLVTTKPSEEIGSTINDNNESSANANNDSIRIDTYDTKIERIKIPLKHHTIDYLYPSSETSNNYTIHSVRVQNDTVAERLKSLHSENDTTTGTPPPLVILHGYMNGGAYFYRNFIGLSSYFPTIYSLDLLGWGLSSRPDLSKSNLIVKETKEQGIDEFYTEATTTTATKETKERLQLVRAAEDFFVESIEAWRIANNIDKFVLAGHSMGGYISVAYAEKYPQNVDKLVLISPVGVPEYTIDEQKKRQKRKEHMSITSRLLFYFFNTLYNTGYTPGVFLRSFPEWYVYKIFNGYIVRRVPLVSNSDEQNALSDLLFYNTMLPGSGEYCLDMILNDSIHAYDPLVHRINQLQISNVGFIYGEHDWMDPTAAVQLLLSNNNTNNNNKNDSTEQQQQQTNVEQEEELESKNGSGPTIEVYVVSNSGHLLMLENWKEFNNALLQFTSSTTTTDTTPTTKEGYQIPYGSTTTQPTKVQSLQELEAVRTVQNFSMKKNNNNNNNQSQMKQQQQEKSQQQPQQTAPQPE